RQPKNLAGEYHYRVWLPAGYHENASREYPCIFIASPSGNAGMGSMFQWIRDNEYIAIMLVESKNGPWGPCQGNFIAAHDDAMQRFRISKTEKLATGFSGGARASAGFVGLRPGFRALLLQGAGDSGRGVWKTPKSAKEPFRVAILMGTTDRNREEIQGLQSRVFGKDAFRSFLFEGGHTWAPGDLFYEAANWAIGKAPAAPAAGK
ncbi:MAG: hypothetical protein U1E27_13855, partial [Kiritimatiellia bacterium]|nr:hypothetical protein [Kiritimatiellia bacterium]